MTEQLRAVNGLILAGGESARMGTDKGLLNFHGIPQREYLFQLLQKFCGQVFLSCKPKMDVPASLNPLIDKFEIKGPMNGILSAFSENRHCAWITVPVDMPHIDEKIVAHLLQQRDTLKIATCFYDSGGHNPEPLFAIWEPASFEPLKKFCSQGKISPRDFLRTHDARIIQSPTDSLHLNVNSPEDLRRFYEDKNHSS